VERCPPGLLHARRGERRKTNHIARGINMLDICLEILVHVDEPTRASFYPGLLESQMSRITLSSCRD
jgi:hypothetical protein